MISTHQLWKFHQKNRIQHKPFHRKPEKENSDFNSKNKIYLMTRYQWQEERWMKSKRSRCNKHYQEEEETEEEKGSESTIIQLYKNGIDIEIRNRDKK